MNDDRPHPELLPLSIAAKLIELGLDIQAGRVRGFSVARRLAEEIFTAVLPASEYKSHLTRAGAAIAEELADAAEVEKFADATKRDM